MSHQTVRLAECATEIRESCDQFLAISPVASPEDVQAFCETIRLNAALMAGLGKGLSESNCVRNTNREPVEV